MGKLFDRLINGKPDKKDFTPADLPKNRLDLFVDVVKMRFTGLITVNLLYVVFLLPLIIFSLFSYFAIVQEVSLNNGIDAQLLKSAFNTYLLMFIPLYAIAGPAKAGVHYVIRNWSWGEQASPVRDFFKEFKRSWKKGLMVNLLVGVLIYAIWFWFHNFVENQTSGLRYVFITGISLIAFLYFLMSIYIYPIMVTYDLPLTKILKNSAIFGLMLVPRNILVLLCMAVVIIVMALIYQISSVIILVMGFSLFFLAKTIYCGSVFDRFRKNLTDDDVAQRRGMAPQQPKSAQRVKNGKSAKSGKGVK